VQKSAEHADELAEAAKRGQSLAIFPEGTLLRRSGLLPFRTGAFQVAAEAGIPVVQLSIDERQPGGYHFEIGKRLAPLRNDGVLIVGSGNIVHNLHAYAWGRQETKPFEWAVRFEHRARELMLAGDHRQLIAYETLGQDAMLSIPTPDHYLPLLYVIATRMEGEPIRFPVEGMDGGSVSMLAVRVG